MFVEDAFNNVGRSCSLPHDTRPRRWVLCRAVSGYRYLVRNVDTGKHRVVGSRDMSSLY